MIKHDQRCLRRRWSRPCTTCTPSLKLKKRSGKYVRCMNMHVPTESRLVDLWGLLASCKKYLQYHTYYISRLHVVNHAEPLHITAHLQGYNACTCVFHVRSMYDNIECLTDSDLGDNRALVWRLGTGSKKFLHPTRLPSTCREPKSNCRHNFWC